MLNRDSPVMEVKTYSAAIYMRQVYCRSMLCHQDTFIFGAHVFHQMGHGSTILENPSLFALYMMYDWPFLVHLSPG